MVSVSEFLAFATAGAAAAAAIGRKPNNKDVLFSLSTKRSREFQSSRLGRSGKQRQQTGNGNCAYRSQAPNDDADVEMICQVDRAS